MTIHQKVALEHFHDVVTGAQREIRLTADAVHEGDTVVLEEWAPHTQEYTGRKIETVVIAVRLPSATANKATPERPEKKSQLIQFEPKVSKYTPAS